MRGLPKTYAKMGFKKGWKAYRKTHGKKSNPSSSRKRKRRTVTKKTYRRKAAKMFRTMGWQGLLTGLAIMTGVKYLLRRFVPQVGAYSNGISMLAGGVVKRSLIAPSIMELGSEAIVDLFAPNGLYTLPTFGRATGTYDL